MIGYSQNNLGFETSSYNDGWEDFESKLEGTAFDKKKVEVGCKVRFRPSICVSLCLTLLKLSLPTPVRDVSYISFPLP